MSLRYRQYKHEELYIFHRVGVGRKMPRDIFFQSGKRVSRATEKETVVMYLDTGKTYTKSLIKFPCCVPKCEKVFSTPCEFKAHYENYHCIICSVCQRRLPNSYLLELHLTENHSKLFAELARKQPMYRCFILGCRVKSESAEERYKHCFLAHRFQTKFCFDYLVNYRDNLDPRKWVKINNRGRTNVSNKNYQRENLKLKKRNDESKKCGFADLNITTRSNKGRTANVTKYNKELNRSIQSDENSTLYKSETVETSDGSSISEQASEEKYNEEEHQSSEENYKSFHGNDDITISGSSGNEHESYKECYSTEENQTVNSRRHRKRFHKNNQGNESINGVSSSEQEYNDKEDNQSVESDSDGGSIQSESDETIVTISVSEYEYEDKYHEDIDSQSTSSENTGDYQSISDNSGNITCCKKESVEVIYIRHRKRQPRSKEDVERKNKYNRKNRNDKEQYSKLKSINKCFCSCQTFHKNPPSSHTRSRRKR